MTWYTFQWSTLAGGDFVLKFCCDLTDVLDTSRSLLASVQESPHKCHKCRYRCKREGWQTHMRLVCQHYARQYPWERTPLFQDIQSLAEGPGTGLIPFPEALLTTSVLALHPSSWFAVAWWPAYRIPDEPLEAAFLAFHSIHTIQQQLRQVQLQPQVDLTVLGDRKSGV